MRDQQRRAAYVSLWGFALAFGWIEASVVVYLRELHARAAALNATSYLPSLPVALVSLPDWIVALEMAREACTLVLLAAVGWLAGRRSVDRVGAFLLSFGVWDLAYYAVLRLILAWPENLGTWDVLFLIPAPWVAPVWAPVAVATIFVLAGSYLFWTSDRERRYRWMDIAVLVGSALLTIGAFLVGAGAVVDHRVPEHFPNWLFWSGVALGTAWFLRVEQGAIRTGDRTSDWVGVRVRAIVPAPTAAKIADDVGHVMTEYGEARSRLDALATEAGELAERFERLAHGLSRHPQRLMVGLPDDVIESPREWDIVPSHPLPTIEHLNTLTNDIRTVGAQVDDLRERLILMGHADLVAQPNGFFL